MKRWIALALLAAALAANRASAALDGGETFVGQGGMSANTTYFLGPEVASTAAQNTFWLTARGLGTCTVSVSLATAPGVGNTLTAALYYNTVAPVAGNSCADDVAAMSSVTVGTISGGTQKYLTGAVSTPAGAGSCLQLKLTTSGTNAAPGFSRWSVFCTETGGVDGISSVGGTGTNTSTTTQYFGAADPPQSTSTDIRSYFIAPYAINAMAGSVNMTGAPSASATPPAQWNEAVRVSTTGLGLGAGTTTCSDLAYNPTSTECSITGTQKSCSWSIDNAAQSSTFSCFGIVSTAVNSPGSPGTEDWSIAYTASSSAPYSMGGPVFNAATDTDSTGDFLPAYWINNGNPLTLCNTAMVFARKGAGTGTWTIQAEVSTTGLGAGQQCSDLTYTDTTICTLTVGTHDSCTSINTALNIPAGGCFRLQAIAGGAISQGTGGANYAIGCSEAVPTYTPTPSPTPTPTGGGATPTATVDCTNCCNNGTPGVNDCSAPVHTPGQVLGTCPNASETPLANCCCSKQSVCAGCGS